MHSSAFLDANGAPISSKAVSLYVINVKRRWRDAPEITIEKLARIDGSYAKGSDLWLDCVVLNLLRYITQDYSGKSIEDAMRALVHTESGFSICSALYLFGVRRFA